ncbi:MAG: BACON domain-containing protein [Bryobacteraceae bacterium]
MPVARSATLTIAGNAFTIQQAGADCSTSTNQSTASAPASGATLTVNVTATSNACTWSTTGMPSWITVTSGATGTGNGVVILQVQPNTSALPRGVTILVAGNGFNITQSAATGTPTSNLRFVPLAPCRLMETRAEYNYEGRTGAFGPPYVKAGETRTLTPSNSTVCQVPTTARAFVLNITLIPRSGVDFVTLFPAGEPRPDFFSIRSPDGQIVANQAIVKAGNGALSLYASHEADVLLDISGYFADPLPTGTNLVFYPLTPCRVIETRAAYRTPAGPFGPPSMAKGETRHFRFPSSPHCTIPAGAAAYSATLTAVPPLPLPYMTMWASGSVQPNVSSINSFAGRTLANNVIVPASTNGEIDVFAFDRTDFLVDINGYFAADNGQGLYYNPVTQCRASDADYGDDTTRTIAIPTAGNCAGIPATAKGYVINATAIPAGSPMPFLTLYPTGQPRPNASVLNAFEGQTVTNTAIIPAGANGSMDVYSFKRTRVVVDVSGYFSR